MTSPDSKNHLASRARWSLRLPARELALGLLGCCFGACATGADGIGGEQFVFQDATLAPDAGDRPTDASGFGGPARDAAWPDGTVDAGDTPQRDAAAPDLDASEGGADAQDAGADATLPSDSGLDASDTAPDGDTGVVTREDASTDAGDAGGSDAALPPLDCNRLVRTGVQLCDVAQDSCGVLFTNTSGCTATCAAGGLVCGMAYENVEGQCARDQTRPALACDSGHQSDYCVCRRP